jgi:nitrite reductase/ring-hydroxylating ferredoxin subunit
MASVTHVVRRPDLPTNGLLHFEVGGLQGIVADAEGDVRAYAVTGPASTSLDRAVVAEGRLRCPLHGWPIDPDDGRCGAAELCQYRPLPIEITGDEIRITLRRL